MGVHGLWKLIDSAGKPIPIEALENKVVAVDVSIWMYQLVKGFQERAGRAVNNPFLLGLFRRICKLLFYRIKPIFVFDGGVPTLKKKTIAARQKNRSKATEISESLKKTLLQNLAKQHALGKALGQEDMQLPKMLLPKEDTMFHLPPLPNLEKDSDEESDSDENIRSKYVNVDIHSIDIKSDDFGSLPADIRHDILTELKETRKQNSWAKIHLMPENSNDFSSYQMGRLLKRRAVQVGIEKAEGEMGTRGFTISDIQDILKQHGVDLGQRIAADNTTRFLYSSNKEGKMINIPNLSEIPPKKVKKNYDFNRFEEDNDFYEEMYCSSNESFEEDPYIDDFKEDLSQEDIFNLIKEETAKKSNIDHFQNVDINLPSTSKASLDIEKYQISNSVETLKNDETVKTVHQEQVNGQQLEHGNNVNKNNKQLNLDHESFPRVDCKTISLQNDSLLSSNYNVKEKDNADSKSSEFNISDVEVRTEHKVEFSFTTDEDKEVEDNLITAEDVGENKEKNITKEKHSILLVGNYEENAENEEILKSVRSSTIQSSSESSQSDNDDDFLEVDVSTGNNLNEISMSKTENKVTQSTTSLEIVVPTDIINEEEDIFADVFKSDQSSETSIVTKVHDKNRESLETTSGESSLIVNKNDTNIQQLVKLTTESEKESAIKKQEVEPENIGNKVNVPYKSDEIKTTQTAGSYFKNKQLNLEEIINMKNNLEKESSVLIEETKREQRLAASITEQTTIEVQELLRLFGLPFIVAPMEAEAQCAYLDISGQTQGTITDDSDIWLFGASNVYKNFFDQRKFVKQFKASDIQRVYHMNREDLIMLAMLTGSDYTTGLPGIGPVNALEIIAQFKPRENSTTPDQRLTRFVNAYLMKKIDVQLAKKLKHLHFVEGFPCSDVVKAYLSPAIDDSKEPFSWALPNLERLRLYAEEKFGWTRSMADQVLLPIVDKFKQNQIQKTIHNYFEWAFEGVEKKMSRRVEKAVNILGGSISPQKPITKTCSPQKPVPISTKVPMKSMLTNQGLPMKSKTPAQIAREKAAKKLKEIRKKENEKKKQKSSKK